MGEEADGGAEDGALGAAAGGAREDGAQGRTGGGAEAAGHDVHAVDEKAEAAEDLEKQHGDLGVVHDGDSTSPGKGAATKIQIWLRAGEKIKLFRLGGVGADAGDEFAGIDE